MLVRASAALQGEVRRRLRCALAFDRALRSASLVARCASSLRRWRPSSPAALATRDLKACGRVVAQTGPWARAESPHLRASVQLEASLCQLLGPLRAAQGECRLGTSEAGFRVPGPVLEGKFRVGQRAAMVRHRLQHRGPVAEQDRVQLLDLLRPGPLLGECVDSLLWASQGAALCDAASDSEGRNAARTVYTWMASL